jgi:hypothetical protein
MFLTGWLKGPRAAGATGRTRRTRRLHDLPGLGAGMVGAALAIVLGVYLALAHGVSLSPRDLARWGAELADARRRDEELEVIIRRTAVRVVGKCAVADDVRAGRLGLLEAAACFRDLQAADPSFDWDRFREYTPGATDEERLARAVIGFVANSPDADPGPAELVGRLKAELAARLRDGTLRLREPRRPFSGWTADPDSAGPPPAVEGGPARPRPGVAARCE